MFGAHAFGAPYFGQAESLTGPPVPITPITSVHVTGLTDSTLAVSTPTSEGLSITNISSGDGINVTNVEDV